MDFSSTRNEMYQSHLYEINGIKFTSREIDIISCILHNRGNKKIASLLSIAHRTVDSHIYNVISKINKNSREDIIDFAEISGKTSYIKKYYLCLRIEAAFNKKLFNIAKTINKEVITYVISDTSFLHQSQEASQIINQKLQQLQKDLKLANIILNLNVSESVHFYILKPDNAENKKSSKEIGLLVDDVINESTNQKIDYVDFTVTQNYYFSVFDLLKKIINKPELDNLKEDFQKEYYSILDNIDNEEISKESIVKIYTTKFAKILLTILLGCLITFLVFFFYTYDTKTYKVVANQNLSQVIQKMISEGFSAGNIKEEQISKNHDLIKQVENIIKQSKNEQYFDNTSISSKEISLYLYVIHSLASYYLFHEDAAKANELLEYAKNLIEQYTNSRNRDQLDFSKFDYEEIYRELSITQDFPQLYTKIIYSLGRANIFLGKQDKALNYFLISRDLGNKLNLFEGYLSSRSGLGIIQGTEAIKAIKIGNHKEIETTLNEVVGLYKKLKDDNKPYILNYQSSNIEPKIVVPKEDIFNQLVCTKQILYYYGLLVVTTDQTENRQKYLQEISEHLIGSTHNKGFLELVNDVSNKEAAKIYNIVGNLLLKFYDNNINFEHLKVAITEKKQLNNEDELEVIRQIFEMAKSKSRSMEFTKADSYNGLAQVYIRKLKQNISSEIKKELSIKIEELHKERDKINKVLNRNIKTILD